MCDIFINVIWNRIKQIIKPYLPVFIFRYICIFKYLLKKNKLYKIKFPYINIPLDGYLPSHIKDYDKIQEKLIKNIIHCNKLVVFFNIAKNVISGGMLSVDRFVYHSLKIAKSSGFEVIQSGIPLYYACIKNDYFNWSTPIIDFKYVIKYLKLTKLIINIPEAYSSEFIENLSYEMKQWLIEIPVLKINILNQNDMLMPEQQAIEKLRELAKGNITITAAHEGYCNDNKSKRYNCPIYRLTPFLPDFYRINYKEKENLILFSPDYSTMLIKIIKKIRKELPDYKIVIIRNMHFEEYKKIISRAKFVISLGEGWDGYFLEAYLSNTIGITVRDPVYFPNDFKNVSTVYSSLLELYTKITDDIKRWSYDEEYYSQVQKCIEMEIGKYINNDKSEKDLLTFYKNVII